MVLFIFFSLISLFFTLSQGHQYLYNSTKIESKQKECKFVLKDNINGYLNWLEPNFLKAAREMNVVITKDISNLGQADVILYHAPTHHNHLRPEFKQKQTRSSLAIISMEQPKYARVLSDLKYINDNFHFTITYTLSNTYPGTQVANIPVSYFPSHLYACESVLKPPKSFQEKSGYNTNVAVVAFTSNCANAGAQQRFEYLKELMNYIPVHSYGNCHHNREEPKLPFDPTWPDFDQKRARKINILREYKFYLAFENFPIYDYVSEKIYEGFISGTVPIYRGTPTIGNFVPSNSSFINANELNPKQLADKIKAYIEDEKAYESFFAFKKEPIAPSFESICQNSYLHPNIVRRTCDAALKLRHKRNQEKRINYTINQIDTNNKPAAPSPEVNPENANLKAVPRHMRKGGEQINSRKGNNQKAGNGVSRPNPLDIDTTN